MAKLLGSERTDTCRGCIAGRDKQGPGHGKPYKLAQRVIKVTAAQFVMKCNTCGMKNNRKLRRAA